MASNRIRPQVGMSGGKPRPRNDSVDSAMIAAATSIVPATITGPSELGRMWRTTWRGTDGAERARRLDELLLAQREELRPHQPRHRHPAKAADHQHDQDEDADLGAERLPSARRGTGRSGSAAAAAAAATGTGRSATSAPRRRCRARCRRWRRSSRRRGSPSASPPGRRRARCGRRRACARRCPGRGRRCRTGASSDGVLQAGA